MIGDVCEGLDSSPEVLVVVCLGTWNVDDYAGMPLK